jgi:Rrf2 family protein
MRVSARSDYALRALIEIGRRADERPVRAEEIGLLQDIPKGFLQAILADLRKADILHAQRGQAGGWTFARPAERVSIADVIRAVDGPLVSVYGVRPEAVEYNDAAHALQEVWVAARTSLREVLEHVTIAALVEGRLPAAVTDRTADRDAWEPH